MKKLFFILILAVFASVTVAYGQKATNYTDSQPTTCSDDALHPIAGKPYGYTLSGTPSGGDFHFWATKNTSFISTTASVTTYSWQTPANVLTKTTTELVDFSSNYNVDNTSGTVTITWSSALLSNTGYKNAGGKTATFVAGYYKDPTGCSDNFKVYELDPKNGFTVDVLSLNPTTFLPDVTAPYAATQTQCTDIVRSATYNSGTMNYDYGTNYAYYEFVAANFSQYWVPTFSLSGTNPNQTITYEYTYAHPDTWGTASPTWTALTSGSTQLEVDPSVTSTNLGVSVFVRVTLKHNVYENLSGQTLVMTLDGQNAQSEWDVVNSTCFDPKDADSNDKSTQTITARPTITPGTSSTIVDNTTIVPGNNVP